MKQRLRSTHRLVAVLLFALSGCASHVSRVDHYDLGAQDLRSAGQVTMAPPGSSTGGEYKVEGEIEGLSCANRVPAGSADEREAIDQLKLKAALLDAAYFTPPICVHSMGMDMANNCWDSVICTSVALNRLSE